MELTKWREKAEIVIPDMTVHAYRKGFLRPEFVLERDGKVVATAVKSSIWKSRLDLALGQQTCEVKPKSFFGTTYLLQNGVEQIGSIERERWFTYRSRIDLPSGWPLPLQIFVFWVVYVMWKRAEAAAAASG